MISILEEKLSREDVEINSEVIIFILIKVVPKLISTKITNEWKKFQEICVMSCSKVESSLQLFMALRYVLTRQEDGYEIAQNVLTKELVLAIVRPCFFEFDEWPVELVETALVEDLEPADLIDYIFRFRTLIINFIEGCPIELVDHVYHK